MDIATEVHRSCNYKRGQLMDYIEELKEVIRKLHGSEATHVETVPITESHEGQPVWQGEVEVFDLADHPKASRVYAWSHETDDPENPRRTVTVLHLPPAITPLRAVQVSIASDDRARFRHFRRFIPGFRPVAARSLPAGAFS